MTIARHKLISVSQCQYYHLVTRCVRRSYLCGRDPLTGKSFDHRRVWIEKRIHHLTQVFCIDVFAYSVMQNHTHQVVFVDVKKSKLLSALEILKKWKLISKLDVLCEAYLDDENRQELSEEQLIHVLQLVERIRKKMCSVSEYMKRLNEFIAKLANKEDNCKGHFWESRFKSQALLDVEAIFQCMVYVDLNPFKANVCNSLEESLFTSIHYRIHKLKKQNLMVPFSDKCRRSSESLVSNYKVADYMSLLSSRMYQLRNIKQKGSVVRAFLEKYFSFEKHYRGHAGSRTLIDEFKSKIDKKIQTFFT